MEQALLTEQELAAMSQLAIKRVYWQKNLKKEKKWV